MRIVLIRHGETASNRSRVYLGMRDEPLSQEGILALQAQREIPEKVYVTGLTRTAQTAEALFPGARREVTSGLEEMDFGDFDGRSADDMENDPVYRSWVEGGCVDPCPNGECKEDFSRRVNDAFERLLLEAQERGEDEVVLICHGGTLMAVMDRFAVDTGAERSYFSWIRPCGCGYFLEADDWKMNRRMKLIGEIDCRTAERRNEPGR